MDTIDGWMDDKSSSDPNISIITDHTDTTLHYTIPSHIER
jgi:hypothetical protein